LIFVAGVALLALSPGGFPWASVGTLGVSFGLFLGWVRQRKARAERLK
jgi:hypothetical protein